MDNSLNQRQSAGTTNDRDLRLGVDGSMWLSPYADFLHLPSIRRCQDAAEMELMTSSHTPMTAGSVGPVWVKTATHLRRKSYISIELVRP